MQSIIFPLSFLSGICALIYQVAWLRLLGLNIGTAAVALAAVLTAFFVGMAMGSVIAQKALRSGINALRGFAFAEGLTAATALMSLPFFFKMEAILGAVPWVGGAGWSLFLFALLFLLLPSMAIGAAFPLLAAAMVKVDDYNGERLGMLYALNTFGAMVGALLGGFLLIPRWGLNGAVYAAAALNGAVALASIIVARSENGMVKSIALRSAITPGSRKVLVALAVTGFVSMSAEVVWTKYLSIYSGTTHYGFSATMAVFLLGFAIGSLGFRGWMRRNQPGPRHIAILLLMLGGILILTRTGFGLLPSLVGGSVWLGEALQQPLVFSGMALLFLPASICFGALLPLMLRSYCVDGSGIYRNLGTAYAINTLACVIGAVAAALWLVPNLGSDRTLQLTALLPLASALMFMPLTAGGRPVIRTWAMFISLVLLAAVMPGIDYEKMLRETQYRYSGVSQDKIPRFQYISEGHSGVVSLADYGGSDLFLQKNGLKEAVLDKQDLRKGSLAEALLGALPYLLQEDASSAFVIGFGGGTTTRVLAESNLKSIKVVEIEPLTVEAVTQIDPSQFQFMHDGRVTVEYNDARNTLVLDKTQYSIIVSQPSHTWLAGSANLYSKEFFRLVHSRLKPGGVFGQWVNLFHMDATTLRSILRTFYSEFPRGVVFGVMAGSDMLLMGSDQPLVLDYDRTKKLFHNPNVSVTMSHGGLADFEALPSFFLFTRDEALMAAGDAPLSLDANLLVEIRLASFSEQPSGDQHPFSLLQPYIRKAMGEYLHTDNP